MPAPTKHYRAPSDDGATLIEPPAACVGELLAENRAALANCEADWQGRSLSDLRAQARRELLAAARDYTAAYRQLPTTNLDPAGPILLAGHQPQLFHPGVWFKNFLLSRLAREHGAAAVNLIVDHDTLRQPALSVPAGSLAEPRLENVPFDATTSEQPFEERRVIDPQLASSFPERTQQVAMLEMQAAVLPLLWPHVLRELERHGNWGRALAAARHIVEGQWGATTLELPLSTAWDSEPFHWFVTHVLTHLPRFREVHNQSLAEYRQANGLRSAQHPVPDLATDAAWQETPFWAWSTETKERRRLWIAIAGDQTLWRAGRLSGTLPILTPNQSLAGVVTAIAELRGSGIKIRPRALLTTLYARLFLGDLFIHGIGGAKYDEVTDAILANFFACRPPAYLAATATLRLPLVRPAATDEDLRRVVRQLRDLSWHGEDSEPPIDADLVARKRALLATVPPRGSQREWHRQITALNQQLAAALDSRRATLEQSLASLTLDVRRTRLLGSREFSFALFPSQFLRAALAPDLQSGQAAD